MNGNRANRKIGKPNNQQHHHLIWNQKYKDDLIVRKFKYKIIELKQNETQTTSLFWCGGIPRIERENGISMKKREN